MCLSLDRAAFSGTLLSINAAVHPDTGRNIHVVSYQNTVKNLAAGGRGNAMLLHLPAQGLTEANMIDTEPFSNYCNDMRDAWLPKSRSRGPVAADLGAVVFDCGIYTVVLPVANAPNLTQRYSHGTGKRSPAGPSPCVALTPPRQPRLPRFCGGTNPRFTPIGSSYPRLTVTRVYRRAWGHPCAPITGCCLAHGRCAARACARFITANGGTWVLWFARFFRVMSWVVTLANACQTPTLWRQRP